jgi:hypothetical protein
MAAYDDNLAEAPVEAGAVAAGEQGRPQGAQASKPNGTRRDRQAGGGYG